VSATAGAGFSLGDHLPLLSGDLSLASADLAAPGEAQIGADGRLGVIAVYGAP
jgi:hypothetical protein